MELGAAEQKILGLITELRKQGEEVTRTSLLKVTGWRYHNIRYTVSSLIRQKLIFQVSRTYWGKSLHLAGEVSGIKSIPPKENGIRKYPAMYAEGYGLKQIIRKTSSRGVRE